MRVLFASTRGAGHFNPLVPFAEACGRNGHDLLVAGPPSLAPSVEGADPAEFGPPPPNVRVEQWVPQADVLGHAAAVVRHGGSGTTLGTLAAGVPLVVVPLFADQPFNARRVAAVGAGLVVEPPDAGEIRAAVERVLEDDSFRAGARRVAAEMRALPPVDDAFAELAR